MLEKVTDNLLAFCSEWFVMCVIYRIFGGDRAFLELVFRGFIFSCVGWVPIKVYLNVERAHRDDTHVLVDWYGAVLSPGTFPAFLSLVGMVLLSLFLSSTFGETAAGVILVILFAISFFVL